MCATEPTPYRRNKIGHINTKSVEYRLHIRIGKRQEAKGGINNQFLITGFSITVYCSLKILPTPCPQEKLFPHSLTNSTLQNNREFDHVAGIDAVFAKLSTQFVVPFPGIIPKCDRYRLKNGIYHRENHSAIQSLVVREWLNLPIVL